MNLNGLFFVACAVAAWFAAPPMTRGFLRSWGYDEDGVGYDFMLKSYRAGAAVILIFGLVLFSGLAG